MASLQTGGNITTQWSYIDVFGPVAGNANTGGRDVFDFTLVFEQSILSIGPSGILILALPLRWLQLRLRSRKTKYGEVWGGLKLATIAIFGILQLIMLVLWARLKQPNALASRVSIATSTLALCDCIALGWLSFMENRKTIRPSTIICLYLIFSIPFDAVQCRTLWLQPSYLGLHPLAAILSVSIAIKTGTLVLEAKGKRRQLLPAWSGSPPEVLSSILNRGVFWWLNELLLRGFKSSLSVETLWPTDRSLDSKQLSIKLNETWKTRNDKEGKFALLLALMGSLKWPFLAAVFPRICLIGFKFSQPLLINRVVDFVGQKESQQMNLGYGLIGATVLIYLGLAISNGLYNQKTIQFITMTRGALVSMVFMKTLSISSIVATDKGSSTLTLMSTDVERTCRGFENLHEIWASPIEVGIAIWLLERELGIASFVPAVLALASTVAVLKLATFVGPAQAAWNKAVQERVSITSSILGNMKEVKLLGLTDCCSDKIQALRVRELDLSKRARMLGCIRIVLMSVSKYLTPAITFGAFIAIARLHTGEHLSVSTTFTSLSLIVLLTGPLSTMFASIPQFTLTLACFGRIQKFLLEENSTLMLISDEARSSQSHLFDNNDIEFDTISRSKSSPDEVFILKGAAFGTREASNQPIIHDINMTIKRSTLTLLIGKVGSGKSTLLKGLIGEFPCKAGLVSKTFSKAAYCEQQPWLVNGTIKNNILAGSALDEKWYETVINACALDKDFRNLTEGHLSVIGSKGISLSGGQKQRVALARALYSRNPFIICDDVLSGLDWATEDFIWSNVFAPNGLLRQHGITVVLATHTVHHLQEADNIIVLGEDGMIIEQGAFEILNTQNSYVQGLLLKEREKRNTTSSECTDAETLPKYNTALRAKQKIDTRKDLLRRTGDVQVYKYYFKSIGWKHGIPLLILISCGEFLLFFPQLWIKWWAEADTAHPGSQIGMYYSVYLMLGVVGLLLLGFNITYNLIVIGPKSGIYLHLKLLKVVMSAPLSFFVQTDTGITVNRFSQDMSLVDMSLPADSFLTMTGIMESIGGAILIITGMKYMAAAIPISLLFIYCLQLFYLRTSRQLRHLDLESKSPLYTHLLETVQGLSTIRSFGWTSSVLSNSLDLLDISQRPFYLLYCIQRWLNFTLDMFVGALAVVFVGIAVSLSSKTSAGAVGVALLNILSLNKTLALTITWWVNLETSLGAIARLRDLETDTPKEGLSTEVAVPEKEWPRGGGIVFDNIDVAYTSDASLVLRGISFEIEAGQKVAICGRTASGKSSLLLTLFRLLELRSGNITIDGISTSTISRSLLRSSLNIIPQEPILLPGSVRFNALPHNSSNSNSDDKAIIAALSTVELWHLISSSGGLEAEMKSIPLSHGQKQLFCLARAILRRDNSPFLVLDEATSSVDRHTDVLMQSVIRREFMGKTIIAVVHKLDTVMDFDRIVVLEAGLLVEFGAPEELMRKDGGAFRTLWEKQK